jgi:hypothetical protein
MATMDTHPAVAADGGSASGPARAWRRSLRSRQPACLLPGRDPIGGYDQAAALVDARCDAPNGLDRAAATLAYACATERQGREFRPGSMHRAHWMITAGPQPAPQRWHPAPLIRLCPA